MCQLSYPLFLGTPKVLTGWEKFLISYMCVTNQLPKQAYFLSLTFPLCLCANILVEEMFARFSSCCHSGEATVINVSFWKAISADAEEQRVLSFITIQSMQDGIAEEISILRLLCFPWGRNWIRHCQALQWYNNVKWWFCDSCLKAHLPHLYSGGQVLSFKHSPPFL